MFNKSSCLNPLTPISELKATCNANIQTYQLKVSSLDLTPNTRDLFTMKCVAARGENSKSDLKS